MLFAAKRGLLIHIKDVLLLPSSIVGSLIMASTLQKIQIFHILNAKIHLFVVAKPYKSVDFRSSAK